MHLPLGLDRERRGSLTDRAQEEDEACRGLGFLPAVLCDDNEHATLHSQLVKVRTPPAVIFALLMFGCLVATFCCDDDKMTAADK